jgi:hypothetical protein
MLQLVKMAEHGELERAFLSLIFQHTNFLLGSVLTNDSLMMGLKLSHRDDYVDYCPCYDTMGSTVVQVGKVPEALLGLVQSTKLHDTVLQKTKKILVF